jgi:hypothetical protein
MKTCLAALFLFACLCAKGQSQYVAVAAGNPFLSDAEQFIPGDKELQISLTYQNTASTHFYNEDHVSNDLNSLKKIVSNYADFNAVFGFTSRFSVGFELGYFMNKNMRYLNTTSKTSGLADGVISLKYKLLQNKRTRFTLLPVAGIKIPLGSFDFTDGFIVLPLAMQPSSGDICYFASIYMHKVLNDKFSIASYTRYEVSQLISSTYYYHKYGDLWMLSFFGSYKLSDLFTCILQLRLENKDKSHRELDKIIESSGYGIFYVSPQVNFNFTEDFQLGVYADLPLYKYYNGTQLATDYSISVRLMKKIGF